ncbi:MAG: T9SS type A sorting domain-containing protein [Bacteroidia bacterium]|nr:T9SS type A sorting domain-containing protein [Bacteroidia bacterium]
MQSPRGFVTRLCVVGLVALLPTLGFGQAVNDYVAIATGSWTDATIWRQVVSTNPVVLNDVAPAEYPGQTTGTPAWTGRDVYIVGGITYPDDNGGSVVVGAVTVTLSANITATTLLDEVRIQPYDEAAQLTITATGSLSLDNRMYVNADNSTGPGDDATLDLEDNSTLLLPGVAGNRATGDLTLNVATADGLGLARLLVGDAVTLNINDDLIGDGDDDRFFISFGASTININGDITGFGGGTVPLTTMDPGTSTVILGGSGTDAGSTDDDLKFVGAANFYNLTISGDMGGNVIQFENGILSVFNTLSFAGSSNYTIDFNGSASGVCYCGTGNQTVGTLDGTASGNYNDLLFGGSGTKTVSANLIANDQVLLNTIDVFAKTATLDFGTFDIEVRGATPTNTFDFSADGGTASGNSSANNSTLSFVSTSGGALVFNGDGKFQNIITDTEDNLHNLIVDVRPGAIAATADPQLRLAAVNIDAGGTFYINAPGQGGGGAGGGVEIGTLNGPGTLRVRVGGNDYTITTNNLINPASGARGTVEFYATDNNGNPASFTPSFTPLATTLFNVATSGLGTITLNTSLNIHGSWTNDATVAPGTTTLSFNNQGGSDNSLVQVIGGSVPLTLNNVTFNRVSAAPATERQISISNTVRVNGTLTFSSNGWITLTSSGNLQLGPTAQLTDGSGSGAAAIDNFGVDRMFVSDGQASAGSRMGRYATTGNPLPVAAPNNYFPFGTTVDYVAYSPLTLTEATSVTYVGEALFEAKPVLVEVNPDVLRRQLYTYSSNITTGPGSDFSFTFIYVASDRPGGGYPTGFEVRRYDGTAWRSVNSGLVDDGTPSFGVASVSIPPNEDLVQRWAVLSTAGIPVTYYTHVNVAGGGGSNWNNNQTWTTTPTGTGFVGVDLAPGEHPGSSASFPTGNASDRVVILGGTTVRLNVASLIVGEVEIQAGGRLIVTSPTGNDLGVLTGAGTLSLGGTPLDFPTSANASDFVTRGTIEFYGAGGALDPTPFGEPAYNNLTLSGSGVANIKIAEADLTVNGNLQIDSSASLQVGADGVGDIANVTITVNGNVTIPTTSNPSETGNRAIFAVLRRNLGYTAFSQLAAHDLFIRGNLSNLSANGAVVEFTKKGAISQTWSDQGVIRPIFDNTTADQTVTANAPIRFEQFRMAKGTDATYRLTFTSDFPDYTNFAFVGHTEGDVTGADPNFDLSEFQTDLRAGRVVFGQGVNIELFGTDPGNVDAGSLFGMYIDSDVIVELQNNAVVNHTNERILLYGGIVMNGDATSSLTTLNNNGLVYRESGYFEINGGTFNAPQIRPTVAQGHQGAYVQNGGVVNLNGNGVGGGYPRFSMPYSTQSFRMTGGTLRITNQDLPQVTGNQYGLALDIRVGAGNYEVRDGGTLELVFQTDDVERGMLINSTVPFVNVLVDQRVLTPNTDPNYDFGIGTQQRTVYVGAMPDYDAADVPTGDEQQPLVVLGNLTLGAGSTLEVLSEEAREIQVGQNLTLGTNANLRLSDTRLVFNGSLDGNFINNNTSAGIAARDTVYTLVVDKADPAATLTLSGAGLAANDVHTVVQDSLAVNSGILEYGSFRIRAQGTVLNDGRIGTTAAAGRLLMDNTVAQTLAVSSESSSSRIGRLEIDNTAGVTLTGGAIDTLGTLELTNGVFNIGVYGVTVAAPIGGSGFSATKMIRTSGLDSDAGVSFLLTADAASYLLPMGATGYTPIQFTTTGIATTGTLQLNVVDEGLATLASNNPTADALDYYWRTRTSFGGGVTVDYQYNYLEADVVGANEATWVGGYTNGTFGATRNAGGVVDASLNTVTFTGVALENARYSAGVAAKFVGSARVLYNYSNGDNIGGGAQARNWNTASSWNQNPEDITNPHGRSASPPAGTIATSPPTAADIVVIGGVIAGTIGGTTVQNDMDYILVTSGQTAQAAAVYLTRFGNFYGGPRLRFAAGANLAGSNLNVVLPGTDGSGGVFDIVHDNTYTGALPVGDFNAWSRSVDGNFLYNYGTGTGNITFSAVLPEYPNLRFECNAGAGGRERTLPSIDFRVNRNLAVVQSSSIRLSSGTAGDITVGGTLSIGDGNAGTFNRLIYPGSANKRTVTVEGNVTFNNGNATPALAQNDGLIVETGGGTVVHDFRVEGNITLNTGTMVLYNGTGNSAVNIDFSGANNSTFSRGTGGGLGAIPQLYSVSVSKDAAATTATITSDVVLNAGTDGLTATRPIVLNSGTLVLNPANPVSVVLSEGGSDFEIPEETELQLLGNVTASITNGAASPGVSGSSLLLNGKLRVLGNSQLLISGDSTGTNNAADRSVANIIYGSGGNALLEIGGTAFVDVDGQFRRGTLSGTGIVSYRQTGGVAVFGRRIRSTGAGRLNQDATQGIFSIEDTLNSSFVMTGGRLIIANDRQNNGFPDVTINTSTPIDSVRGGVLQLGYSQALNTDGGGLEAINARNTLDGIRLEARQILPTTEVVPIGTGLNTLRIINRAAEFGGTLTITSGQIMRTDGFTAKLDSNLVVDGTFGGTTALQFQGQSDQTFSGTATALTLSELTVAKDVASANRSVTLDLSGSPIISLTTKLDVQSGNLVLVDDVVLTGDTASVADTVSGAGTLVFNRTDAPSTEIGGGGALTNVEVLTSTNVSSYGGIQLLGTVALTGGRWLVNTQPITLLTTTTITDTSGTRYFELTPTGTSQGFRLVLPSAGAFSYGLPVGAPGKYTPVYLQGTVATPGTYLVTLSEDASSAQTNLIASPDSILNYFWRAEALNGLSMTSLTQYFGYSSDDVRPVAAAESDYYPGFIQDGDVSWTRGPQAYVLTAGTPNVSGGLIRFDLPGAGAPITGTYTTGGWTELDVIQIFYSRSAAPGITSPAGVSYSDATSWSVDDVLTHDGPEQLTLVPDPNPGFAGAGRVQIRSGHRITINSLNTEAFNLQLSGPDGWLTVSDLGCRLNQITGSGRLVLDPPSSSANVPDGNYARFIEDSLGTVEFTSSAPGGETYNIPTALNPSVTRYHNLAISGAGTRTFDGNTVIFGNLELNGTASPLNVNLNGQTLTVYGNITRTGTANLTGSGTIILAGGANQVITGFDVGVDSLFNLTISKTAGSVTVGPADNALVISGTLTFNTDFQLAIGANKPVRFSSTASVVGLGPNRFIPGLVQRTVASGVGSTFIFPVGTTNNYRPIEISSAANGLYTASWFAATPPNYQDLGATPVAEQLLQLSQNSGYWSLSAPNGASARIRVAYRNALDPEVDPVTYNEGNLRIAVTDSTAPGTWLNFGGQGTAGITSFAGLSLSGNASVSGEVSTLSGNGIPVTFSSRLIAIGTAVTSFPIELLAFTGERSGSEARLKWVTASELNNDRFEVLRSVDGLTFEGVGFVPGQGTTSDLTQYGFVDYDVPNVPEVYYRLKQYDFDGKYSYSPIIALREGGTSGQGSDQWALYPNPAHAEAFSIVSLGFDIDVLQARHLVTVVDGFGRPIFKGSGRLNELNQSIRQALANVPVGTYIVNVSSGSYLQTLRFVKQ